jgi:hypothetical protein
MRKRVRTLTLAALAAALVVPVVFAWSLDLATVDEGPRPAGLTLATSPAAAPVLLVRNAPAARFALAGALDGVALFAVGALLLGLAAAVRRSA